MCPAEHCPSAAVRRSMPDANLYCIGLYILFLYTLKKEGVNGEQFKVLQSRHVILKSLIQYKVTLQA
jgi:hypothetical protein